MGFERVIGYEEAKRELRQICDMVHNKEVYEKIGAKMPSGLLIEGEPGVGKTLMATALIEESGIKSYVVRRSKLNGDFVESLEGIFDDAVQNAPSIVLLDDMDKFAINEKSKEEFIAVQTCVDKVKGKGVFVIATVNSTEEIPESLIRAGRFDRHIEIKAPKGEDSINILNHFMETKSVLGDINKEDISKMLEGNTCAEVETIINEASIYAAYERKERVEREHIINATLRQLYNRSAYEDKCDSEVLEYIAYHEAGHAVICDIINEGSVGLITVSVNDGGLMRRCKPHKRRPYEILTTLGGKASTEVKFGKVGSGAVSDLDKARHQIIASVGDNAVAGCVNLLDTANWTSEKTKSANDAIVASKMEEYLFKAKEIIAYNMEYLEKVAQALIERRTLLNSDIKKIRESVTIKNIEIS